MDLVQLIANTNGELYKANSKTKEKVEVEPLGQPKLIQYNSNKFSEEVGDSYSCLLKFFKKIAVEKNEFKESDAFCASEVQGIKGFTDTPVLQTKFNLAFFAIQYYKIK